MSWYVEFEVENKEAEIRFWDCVHKIGESAENYINEEPFADMDLINDALAFAREMGYHC